LVKELITYLESHQPIATLFTGFLAVFAVILSQLWLDFRQRKSHKHEIKLKERELKLIKKEELIEIINLQIKEITRVEDLFNTWFKNFEKNYSAYDMKLLLRDVDNRINKVHILVQLYFPIYKPYINKIINKSDAFLESCADYSMAAEFGPADFLNLEQTEIFERCNEYSVAYMHLAAHLIEPELINKYPLKQNNDINTRQQAIQNSD